MSNYLFLVADRRRRAAAESWLRTRAAHDEVHTATLKGARTLFVVSREVERSVRGESFFRGSLVSERDGIVFGPDGWAAAPVSTTGEPGAHGGEYLVADWGDGRLRIDRDLFGNARLLTTAGEGFAAASDSLLVLTALRRALGAPVTANTEALLARTVRAEVFGQQLSPETMIDEIEFVPACRGLRLSRLGLGWRLTGTPVAERMPRRGAAGDGREGPDYADAIRSAATRMAATAAALTSSAGWTTRLNLSGGFDSRVVLAAAQAAGCADRLRITSHASGKRASPDVEIARVAAEGVGLRLELTRPPGTPSEHSPEELSWWASSLLGVYDGYEFMSAEPWPGREFLLTGLGAGVAKGGWGSWKTRDELVSRFSLTGAVSDAVSAQWDKSSRSLAADPALADWGDCYYLGYRNALHSSAGHIRMHMTGFMPLMQFSLAELAHTPVSGRRAPGTSFIGSDDIVLDISAILSPELSVLPYEGNRDQSRARVEERLRRLGGAITAPDPMRVHGSPDDVVAGASEFSQALAREAGFIGTLTPETYEARAGEAIDLLRDPTVRDAYAELDRHARWQMERHGRTLRVTGVNTPRVLALGLLRYAA